MKRYAIVRVDNRCPVEEEEDIYLIDRIKMFPCFNDKRLSCKNCRYGDTKEQLIKKIKQVITRVRYAIEMGEANRIADDEGFAKEIVEFLGVE